MSSTTSTVRRASGRAWSSSRADALPGSRGGSWATIDSRSWSSSWKRTCAPSDTGGMAPSTISPPLKTARASPSTALYGEDAAAAFAPDLLHEALHRLLARSRLEAGAMVEALEHLLDLLEEDVLGEGLRDVVDHPEAEGPHALAELAVGGQEHHRYARGLGVALQLAKHPVAVEHGHRDVAEHEIRHLTPGDLVGFLGLAGAEDLVAGALQEGLHEQADVLVVLHQEDLARLRRHDRSLDYLPKPAVQRTVSQAEDQPGRGLHLRLAREGEPRATPRSSGPAASLPRRRPPARGYGAGPRG